MLQQFLSHRAKPFSTGLLQAVKGADKLEYHVFGRRSITLRRSHIDVVFQTAMQISSLDVELP